MNYREYLFMKHSEECGENIQCAAKASLFGNDSTNPATGLTNEEELINEIHDFMAMVDMMHENGLINFKFDPEKIRIKKQKVIYHAISQGVLQGEAPNPIREVLFPTGKLKAIR